MADYRRRCRYVHCVWISGFIIRNMGGHPTTVTTLSAAHQEQPQSQESQKIATQPLPCPLPHQTNQELKRYLASVLSLQECVKREKWVPCIPSPTQDTRNRIQNIRALRAQRDQLPSEERMKVCLSSITRGDCRIQISLRSHLQNQRSASRDSDQHLPIYHLGKVPKTKC